MGWGVGGRGGAVVGLLPNVVAFILTRRDLFCVSRLFLVFMFCVLCFVFGGFCVFSLCFVLSKREREDG